MAFDSGCDFIIGVGSGTINDIGKLLANITGLNYAIVCTAPSMDGFASINSSMIVRLKGTMDMSSRRDHSRHRYIVPGSGKASSGRAGRHAGKVYKRL